jgi:hypothetical protein
MPCEEANDDGYLARQHRNKMGLIRRGAGEGKTVAMTATVRMTGPPGAGRVA